jgi:ribose transport system substrate-binding protein
MVLFVAWPVAQGFGQAAVQFKTSKKNGFVIGFANGYIGNTWRAQFIDDVQKGADRYKATGLLQRIDIANSPADVSQQLTQLNSMINSDIDALMIDPVSPTSLGPVIQAAKAKGILVVITNDAAAYPGTYCFVGNNHPIWTIEPEWIAQKLNGKGNIVMVHGLPGNIGDQLRIDDANAVLKKYPNIKVLASVPGKWSPSVAQQEMTTILSTYKKIDAILTQDVMPMGIIQAFANAGRKPVLMTGDYTFDFLRKWKELGLDSIAITYDPAYGFNALGLTLRILQGKSLKDGVLQENPLDPTLKNAILFDPAYVITNEAQPKALWMKPLKFTEAIGLDQALKLGAGQPDNAAIDRVLTEEQLDSYFK